ncbi:nucleotidyltransferase family protein [Parasalinivibrio latis]|uniref:nucleotidyltransferase family protein n=1 Tax=Parasalinivibrio latis TaxID=2952610 RepID=UPI0030E3FB2C
MRLVEVLRCPELFACLGPREQAEIISEARFFGMQSQLLPLFNGNCHYHRSIWGQLPLAVRQQLSNDFHRFSVQKRGLVRELRMLTSALGDDAVQDMVVLKGAAYHLAKIEELAGRTMSDIDVWVSERQLKGVEEKLVESGWVHSQLNSYDDRFYREWSQEIPPLKHYERRIELDVHFRILPKALDSSDQALNLLRYTQWTEQGIRVLTLPAMIIHSAIHLFYESEYRGGPRDLFDLYLLFSRLSQVPEGWHSLISIQEDVGQGDSVYLALRYCQKLFRLAVPEKVMAFYSQYAPAPVALRLLDNAFMTVFSSGFPPHRPFGYDVMALALYLRGHVKRLPMPILLPHLVRKTGLAVANSFKKPEKEHEPLF